MYKAHLNDPLSGNVVATADTPEQAVELAFRELASSWMSEDEITRIVVESGRLFDGEIKGVQVWWYNHTDVMLGTVVPV